MIWRTWEHPLQTNINEPSLPVFAVTEWVKTHTEASAVMDKLQYLNKSVSVSYIAQGRRSLFRSFQYLLSLRTEINCLSAEVETHNNTDAEYAFLSIAIRQIGAMSSEAANNYHWVTIENSQSAWTKLEFIGVLIKFARIISQNFKIWKSLAL